MAYAAVLASGDVRDAVYGWLLRVVGARDVTPLVILFAGTRAYNGPLF